VTERRTVFVLDDAPEMVLLVEALLSTVPGLDVSSASDGVEGLAQIGRRSPDLVLLDLQLPGLSGREVLAALRADPATCAVRVVLFTGDRARTPGELLALGADAQLSKPFTAQALIDCVVGQLFGERDRSAS
jgi:CheY-like chemotaxis protein